MAPDPQTAVLIERARDGDRRSLARLLTLVEKDRPEAREAVAHVFPTTGSAYVTGITGAPGAGKSTLTDRLISRVRSDGTQVAVLAVDPSSPFTGGAILGDRVRMQGHIDDPGVYIRSMANRGRLGGIAEATPRAVAMLDGIGFTEIVIETVGVGQAEVDIVANVDTTVVVVNPGWGDAIQAAKAGLLEIGDVFVVNKYDRAGAKETVRDLQQMLELGGHRAWWPPIVGTVATTDEGVAELWSAISDHRRHLDGSGEGVLKRQQRLVSEMERAVAVTLERRAGAAVGDERHRRLVEQVVARRLDPWTAAELLLDGWRSE